MKRFVRVYKDAELDDDGVTPVWKWKCSHYACIHRTVDHGAALYWENAIRQANFHVKWHKLVNNSSYTGESNTKI